MGSFEHGGQPMGVEEEQLVQAEVEGSFCNSNIPGMKFGKGPISVKEFESGRKDKQLISDGGNYFAQLSIESVDQNLNAIPFNYPISDNGRVNTQVLGLDGLSGHVQSVSIELVKGSNNIEQKGDRPSCPASKVPKDLMAP